MLGCSTASSSSSFPAGGSPVDVSVPDAGSDAHAGANSCVTDAGPGLPCRESLASYCAAGQNVGFPNGGCTSTLQSVKQNPPCASAEGLQTSFESCGPLELMSMSGIDFGPTYVYDVTSGALIAVTVFSDPQGFSCLAGPPCLAIPSCGPLQVVCDAGADAGQKQ